VKDPLATIEHVAEALKDGKQDRLDGLTVEFDDWWCNVRPSNTEPLLRLNVEARTDELLREKTAMVLELIRGEREGS
jgi:Phosphomannomutase